MPGNPTKREEVARLKREIEELRAQIGITVEGETWGENLSQEMRDEFALKALFQEWGNEGAALHRLGIFEDDPQKRAVLRKRIFGTPGVRKLRKEMGQDAEANKQGIIQRLTKTARYGDDSNSNSATRMLAGLMGWTKSELAGNVTNIQNNIFQQVAQAAEPRSVGATKSRPDPNEIIDAADFLVHEPGEAEKVIDEVETVKALSA